MVRRPGSYTFGRKSSFFSVSARERHETASYQKGHERVDHYSMGVWFMQYRSWRGVCSNNMMIHPQMVVWGRIRDLKDPCGKASIGVLCPAGMMFIPRNNAVESAEKAPHTLPTSG